MKQQKRANEVNKIAIRTVVPVVLKNGCCPNPALHFRGAAREVFKYLQLLAKQHGGFVFPTAETIARSTKNWARGKDPDSKDPLSVRQIRRILKIFRTLRIISERRTVTIRGREFTGFQFVDHAFWAEPLGHLCYVKAWSDNYQEDQEDVVDNVTLLVTPDVTQNVTMDGLR
jgi:hypothetical protein